MLLQAELRGGLTRITLLDPEEQSRTVGPDALSLRAAQTELDQLRDTISQAPFLVWRESAEGEVTWANAAYLSEATLQLGLELAIAAPVRAHGEGTGGGRAKANAEAAGGCGALV